MSAAEQLVQEMFTVIEGGADLGSAAEIIQFPSDNGQKVFEVVQKTQKGTNGTGMNYWVTAFATGVGVAARAISSGAALLTMSVPAAATMLAPAMGITVGYAWYNLAPDFWDSVAEKIIAAGDTINGKIVALMNTNGVVTFPPSAVNAIKDALLEAGFFDTNNTWDGNMPEGFSLESPINTFSYGASPAPPDICYSGWIASGSYPYLYGGCAGIPNQEVKVSSAILENGKLANIVTSKSPLPVRTTWYFVDPATGLSKAGGSGVSHSYTFDDKTVYYSGIDIETGVVSFGTNKVNFDHRDELAWVMEYGTSNPPKYKDAQQPDAIMPTLEDILDQFPNWIWDFPPVIDPNTGEEVQLPSGIPIEYPDILPKIETVQEPAQNPQNDKETNPEKVIETIQDPAHNPNNKTQEDEEEKTDPDPEPDDKEEIENPSEGTETPEEPVDPDPIIPPSPVIPVPPLPDTVHSNKLFTVYNPTSSQLDALGGYLWDNDLIDILRKIWQNPLDGIISLSQVYASPVTGSNHNIILGYLDSGVSAPVVTQQFVTIDCGSVTVAELNENCLDYVPYTQMQLYLPFVGVVEIDGNEFMSGTISVKYKIDVYTGTCLAEVKCTRTRDLANGAVLYTFPGNCSQQLPLTSGDASGLFATLASGVGMLAGVASGGATAASFGSGLSALMSREMLHVGHSGSLSANAGIMGQKKPYLIIGRERPYNANNYNKFYGYPANKSIYPGNYSGFVRLKAGRLRSAATEEEKKEIMELMMKGVIM